MSGSSGSRRTNTESTLPLYQYDDEEFPLRPIPEDASDLGGSSVGASSSLNYPQPLTRQQLSLTTTPSTTAANASNRPRGGSVVSSTKAVQAGHAGSVISDAAAVLADSDIGGAGAGGTTGRETGVATAERNSGKTRQHSLVLNTIIIKIDEDTSIL
jgi:hypothetical protein